MSLRRSVLRHQPRASVLHPGTVNPFSYLCAFRKTIQLKKTLLTRAIASDGAFIAGWDYPKIGDYPEGELAHGAGAFDNDTSSCLRH
jgi:hypothetical protein